MKGNSNMSRRKLKNKSIRKIFKKGGSRCLSIPKEILDQLGWRDNQKVIVKKRGKGISVVDWQP